MADVNNPIYYKWYPTEETDLGANPIEGEFGAEDKIISPGEDGLVTVFYSHATTHEWGRNIPTKIKGRTVMVWTPGVVAKVVYTEVDGQQVQIPVWYMRTSDVGVCALKVPNGEVEEVTT